MPISTESERRAFLAAIRANFWEPEADVARLVFADWLAEHGEYAAERRLRYSVMAWQTIQLVPLDGEPASRHKLYRARKKLQGHPNADILLRLGVVAACRVPGAWERLFDSDSERAVETFREISDGLVSADGSAGISMFPPYGPHHRHTLNAERGYKVRVFRTLAALPPMGE